MQNKDILDNAERVTFHNKELLMEKCDDGGYILFDLQGRPYGMTERDGVYRYGSRVGDFTEIARLEE